MRIAVHLTYAQMRRRQRKHLNVPVAYTTIRIVRAFDILLVLWRVWRDVIWIATPQTLTLHHVTGARVYIPVYIVCPYVGNNW